MNADWVLSEMADLPEFVGANVPLKIDSVGCFGNSPLNIAATQGDLESVRTLLDEGADINFQGEEGSTPLHDAIEQNHQSVIHFLVQRGASKCIKNKEGMTASSLAALLGITID